jgi:MFS transporter, Spinster family, sphingosine-1-phosphate transporter
LATESASSSINRIWITAALLAPAALLNYLDRQMLASMKFSVTHSVSGFTSEQQWGVMLAQFKWVYAFLSPIGGYCADRFSRSKVICLSLFCWSLITWLTGQAHTFQHLMWIRTAMGVSESLYIPAALALIVESGTGKNSSKAVALHTGAIYVGMILGGFAGYAADSPTFGWRAAFHLAGLAGLVYACVLAFGLRDAPRREESRAATLPLIVAGRELISNRSFLLLAVYYTLIAMPAWMMKDWMPGMLKEHFDLSQGRAGVSASLYVNIAGFAGLGMGAWLADRRVQKHLKGRIQVSAFGMLGIVPALAGLGSAPNLAAAVLFLALFGIMFGMYDTNNMPILSQLVRPELRATAYGLMNCVSVAVGGFADVAVGRMKDAGLSFAAILTTGACLAAFNTVLILLVKPRKELTPEYKQ